MLIRKRYLSEGWYPQSESSAARDIDACLSEAKSRGFLAATAAVAAVAPHASWYYSGIPAAAAVASLRGDAETVVVCGGHLSEDAEPLMAMEDAFSTPFGLISSDTELMACLTERFDLRPDTIPDNTVEIQLPFVKRFFPAAKVVCMRMPAAHVAFEIGTALKEFSLKLERRVAVLGSTDLTHYGPNYGFTPKGLGSGALNWVRETNDKRFIDAVLGGNADRAISLALSEGSACSPGGAAAALGFSQASGPADGRLLCYSTSADISPSSSFVGYAAICWTPK